MDLAQRLRDSARPLTYRAASYAVTLQPLNCRQTPVAFCAPPPRSSVRLAVLAHQIGDCGTRRVWW
jgi:hypothetical protein